MGGVGLVAAARARAGSVALAVRETGRKLGCARLAFQRRVECGAGGNR
jgi:hypothetical protein